MATVELLGGIMDFSLFRLPAPVALALVALIGYLVGRRRRAGQVNVLQQSRRELRRAQQVATELERIAGAVCRNLARHRDSLDRFKERVGELNGQGNQSAWMELCEEAEAVLKPTLRLAAQMAEAYDEIRQQSSHLMTFTELRTDSLTGVSNRRAFDEALGMQFALMSRYDSRFALVMLDINHFKHVNDEHGHLEGDRVLQAVARLLDDAARETDIVVRYGGEEFAVITPCTDLDGASVFAERVRVIVADQTPITISGGVALALDGDTPESLVARADMALYGAKMAGRNCIFRHTGEEVEAVIEPLTAPPQ